jgi:hypothetical protein
LICAIVDEERVFVAVVVEGGLVRDDEDGLNVAEVEELVLPDGKTVGGAGSRAYRWYHCYWGVRSGMNEEKHTPYTLRS